ncbi:DoxX family protein [Puia sp.]|uniref:DoxX family protein n=1 Tax=Puia sp. TaxID=2045100 RepID=UPI002F3EC1FB
MLPSLAKLYLRLSLGIAYTYFGLDRLGAWGPYGKPWVSWGDWSHFSPHAHHLMYFLPSGLAEAFAVIATIVEITSGILLTIGLLTRWAAFASFGLAFCFALFMSIADGFTSPLGYSVFTVSAASLLLATQPGYRWSIDHLRTKNPASRA